MSASLVGSEMCIRDRCSRGGAAGARSRVRTCACVSVCVWVRAGARAGAVSYTHLTLPTICSV
eukprot:9361959-Alexandrium_andersonii.AAC.1